MIATTADNKLATRPASVFDGLVTMRLMGFKPSSGIDNNDFSQGLAGWEIGSSPVLIVPHTEGGSTFLKSTANSSSTKSRIQRTHETFDTVNRSAKSVNNSILFSAATAPDYDLRLATLGEGQQSISRTFDVEDGVKSVLVRYRFITSEVPGGWYGSEFNDFYNVSVRTRNGGGLVTSGNSMNGMGLSAFDGNGATGWFETEIPVAPGGDTIQFDIAVANVADGFLNSQVIVDGIKKKNLLLKMSN